MCPPHGGEATTWVHLSLTGEVGSETIGDRLEFADVSRGYCVGLGLDTNHHCKDPHFVPTPSLVSRIARIPILSGILIAWELADI